MIIYQLKEFIGSIMAEENLHTLKMVYVKIKTAPPKECSRKDYIYKTTRKILQS